MSNHLIEMNFAIETNQNQSKPNRNQSKPVGTLESYPEYSVRYS